MKPKITEIQLQSIKNMVKTLMEFQKKGYGKISNLLIMYNYNLPNTILVKFEKEFVFGGELSYEYKIASVGENGVVEFIDNSFKNMFDRYNFISESKVIDLDNVETYTIVRN